jgi:alpha-glucosidase
MLALRKDHSDIFVYGSYTALEESVTGEMVLGYEREWEQKGQKAVVLLNFSDRPQTVSVEKYESFSILVSNQASIGRAQGKVELQPYGAVVLSNV